MYKETNYYHPEEVQSNESLRKVEEQKGFLKEQEIGDFFDSLRPVFFRMGYTATVDATRSPVLSISQDVFAIPIQLLTQEGEQEMSWISVDITKETLDYKLAKTGEILLQRQLSPLLDFEMAMVVDGSLKAVTARSKASYPRFFDLPKEEIWPKGKKVMVVGDPYQRCDGEGITIVDYEYADEIFPDLLQLLERFQSGEIDEMDIYNNIHQFYTSLHTGNMRSVEMVYGSYFPSDGNPYKYFIEGCTMLFADIIEASAKGTPFPSFGEVEKEYQDLKNGTWSIEDYTDWCYAEDDSKKAIEHLKLYKEMVDSTVDYDEKSWKKYIGAWETLLAKIPDSYIARHALQEDKERVTYWLSEVSKPEISKMRMSVAVRELQGLYKKIIGLLVEDKEYVVLAQDEKRKIDESTGFGNSFTYLEGKDAVYYYLSDHVISDVGSRDMMSESAFGWGIEPGDVMNTRVDLFLKESVDFAYRLQRYLEVIFPLLQREKKRIDDLGIDFEENTVKLYMKNLERSLKKEIIHKNNAKKSVVLEGFFPDQFENKVDLQDRIIALYAISTHIWEMYSSPEEFTEDIQKTLSFLQDGGKYVVGPINYRAYHIYQREGDVSDDIRHGFFNGDSLSDSLKTLMEQGKITDYFFRKIDMKTGEHVSTKEFESGDMAASLVIEK